MTAPSLLSPPARAALRGQVMMLARGQVMIIMHHQPTVIAVLAHSAHGAAAITAGLARGRTDADGAPRADANAPSPPLCQSLSRAGQSRAGPAGAGAASKNHIK